MTWSELTSTNVRVHYATCNWQRQIQIKKLLQSSSFQKIVPAVLFWCHLVLSSYFGRASSILIAQEFLKKMRVLRKKARFGISKNWRKIGSQRLIDADFLPFLIKLTWAWLIWKGDISPWMTCDLSTRSKNPRSSSKNEPRRYSLRRT